MASKRKEIVAEIEAEAPGGDDQDEEAARGKGPLRRDTEEEADRAPPVRTQFGATRTE